MHSPRGLVYMSSPRSISICKRWNHKQHRPHASQAGTSRMHGMRGSSSFTCKHTEEPLFTIILWVAGRLLQIIGFPGSFCGSSGPVFLFGNIFWECDQSIPPIMNERITVCHPELMMVWLWSLNGYHTAVVWLLASEAEVVLACHLKGVQN